jgi:hypothetical protein
LEERRVWTFEEDFFCAASAFLDSKFQEERHASSKMPILLLSDGLLIGCTPAALISKQGISCCSSHSSTCRRNSGLNNSFSLEVLDKFTEQLLEASKLPNLEEAAFLYQNTSPKSRLRQLFVNHFIEKMFSIPSKTFAEQSADWNMALSWDDLRYDVMTAIKRPMPSSIGTWHSGWSWPRRSASKKVSKARTGGKSKDRGAGGGRGAGS